MYNIHQQIIPRRKNAIEIQFEWYLCCLFGYCHLKKSDRATPFLPSMHTLHEHILHIQIPIFPPIFLLKSILFHAKLYNYRTFAIRLYIFFSSLHLLALYKFINLKIYAIEFELKFKILFEKSLHLDQIWWWHQLIWGNWCHTSINTHHKSLCAISSPLIIFCIC